MKKIIYIFFIGFMLLVTSCKNSSDDINNSTLSYDVSFETNMDFEIENGKTNKESKITEPIVQPVEGYTFIGWYYDYELTIPFSFDTSINRNIKLYGKWDVQTIHVNLIGSDDIYKTYDFSYGDKLEKLKTPVLAGYECEGLYYDKEFTKKYHPEEEILLKEDLNLYIKWIATKVNIETFVDGKKAESFSVDYDTKVQELPTPQVKEHYTFDGWYKDAPFKQKLNDDSQIKSNTKLYGRYVLSQYEIKFYENNQLVEQVKKDYGQKIYDAFTYQKEGYHLLGLYDDEDYQNEIVVDAILSSSLSVYMKWEINSYEVNLYVDNALYKQVPLNHFEKINQIEKPQKDHFQFIGWFYDEQMTKPVLDEDIIKTNIELYGIYKLETFVITVYEKDKVIKEYQMEYGSSLLEQLDVKKTGYTLDGYYLDDTFTTPVSDTAIVTSTLHIYTKWTINTYTVNLIIDENNTTQMTKKYQETLKDVADPIKEGYLFGGWFKDKDYKQAFPKTSKINQNLTLYAKWVDVNKVPYQIIYKLENVNNNQYTKEKTVTKYAKLNETVHATILSFEGFKVVSVDVSGVVTFDKMLTLEVYYKRERVSLTYYVDGRVYQTIEDVKYGSTYEIPTDLVVENAILDGWFLEEQFENQVSVVENITKNCVLYGKVEYIQTGTEGLIYELNEDEKSYRVTGYNGSETKVTIPNGYNHLRVTAIESMSESKHIQELTILENTYEIFEKAFMGCSSLEKILLPSSLEKIETLAFLDCTGLKEIKLPSKVKTIGIGAFYNCNSLETILVDVQNTTFEDIGGVLIHQITNELLCYPSAKKDTTYQMPSQITSIQRAAILSNPYLIEIIIRDNLLTIGSENFSNCSNLEKITIGKNVCYVSDSILYNTPALKEIFVEQENKDYASIEGVLYSKDQTKLLKYPSAKTENLFIMPESVEWISYNSFESCTNLKEVVLSKNIKYVEKNAFTSKTPLTIYTYVDSYLSTWHTLAFGIHIEIVYQSGWTMKDEQPIKGEKE